MVTQRQRISEPSKGYAENHVHRVLQETLCKRFYKGCASNLCISYKPFNVWICTEAATEFKFILSKNQQIVDFVVTNKFRNIKLYSTLITQKASFQNGSTNNLKI